MAADDVGDLQIVISTAKDTGKKRHEKDKYMTT